MKPQSNQSHISTRIPVLPVAAALWHVRARRWIWKGSYAIVSHDLWDENAPGNVLHPIDIVPRHTDTRIHPVPITSVSPEKGGARHEQ